MTILITGATSGLGLALCQYYLANGVKVIACGRNQNKLDACFAEQTNVSTLCFDITDKEQVLAKCAEISEVDTVVLNAGDCEYFDKVVPFDSEKFERIIRINLISIGYCLEALLPKIKTKGQLVLVSSSAHLLPFPRAEAYGASKAGLSYLAESLRLDLAKHRIDVSLIEPGFVKTPLTDQNNFSMPFLLEVSTAAKLMAKGIEQRKELIRFPTRLMLFLRLFGLLPKQVWAWLINRK